MNTDRIIPVNCEHLLLMQVLVWLAPGMVAGGDSGDGGSAVLADVQ